MFRRFLRSQSEMCEVRFAWVRKVSGLVRTVICEADGSCAYVIVYREQSNQYEVMAFRPATGEMLWSTHVVNGGYGAPALVGDAILVPTKFTNVIALSKVNGDLLWEFETADRLRSPINVVDNRIYFSSGGQVFALHPDGRLARRWQYPGAFFYGSIDVLGELLFTLGTAENRDGKSVAQVFAFRKDGELLYRVPIAEGPVVSSDTSGIGWKGNTGFVGGSGMLVSFQAEEGKLSWSANVEGFAGRHVCVTDDERVYYVTQAGVIGALNLADGSPAWSIHTRDAYLASPVSVVGNRLLVLADAHLNMLDCTNGQLLQRTPVGNAPYSMVSLHDTHCWIGAGEPPHHGLLFSFNIADPATEASYQCTATCSNAFIESDFVDIVVTVLSEDAAIAAAFLDGTILGASEAISPAKVMGSIYSFRVPITLPMTPGERVMPIHLHLETGECLIRPICVELFRRVPLPARAHLDHIPDVQQEHPTFSGAAIASLVKSVYGDNGVVQADIRAMVDACRDLSGYEPFQTWRIILRRVLTSRAGQAHALPEFETSAG